MKKKTLVIACILCLVLCFAGCGSSTENTHADDSSTQEVNVEQESDAEASQGVASDKESGPAGNTTIESIEDDTEEEMESVVADLVTEQENLVKEIDTFEKYRKNGDKIDAFYKGVTATTKEACIVLRERSLKYAELVLASGGTDGEKYDDLDGINDYIYDDAASVIYDGIYDGVLDDMYDDYYDGIIHDAYNDSDYGKWSEASSAEYERWSDAKSDVYDEWSDCKSDIYAFCSDVRSAVYGGKDDRAQKKVDDFREDIEQLKNKS